MYPCKWKVIDWTTRKRGTKVCPRCGRNGYETRYIGAYTGDRSYRHIERVGVMFGLPVTEVMDSCYIKTETKP